MNLYNHCFHWHLASKCYGQVKLISMTSHHHHTSNIVWMSNHPLPNNTLSHRWHRIEKDVPNPTATTTCKLRYSYFKQKTRKKRKSLCKPAFKLQVNASKSSELIVSSPLFEFFCLTKSPTWAYERYGTNSNGLEMSELKVNSTMVYLVGLFCYLLLLLFIFCFF